MKQPRLVLLLAALLFSAPSLADLHSKDDPVFGAGSITYDDTTGLEWLDVDLSTSISYNDIITQFGVGGAFEGWRHASLLEANERSIHAGITINVGSTAANYEPARKLLEMVGVTADSGIGTQALGFIAEPGDNAPGFRKVFSVATHDGPTGSSALAFYQADDLGDPALGHYLVRHVSNTSITHRFEGRLASGQLLEISYTFKPSLAQATPPGCCGIVYSHLIQSATLKVGGVNVPLSPHLSSSIYIQNNLQADQRYDRYQAVLQFFPAVNGAGLSFDRIFLYFEHPTGAGDFSKVLSNENLLIDPAPLFDFPIKQAIFQGGSGGPANPTVNIEPVVTAYDEAVSGDLPANPPLHDFQLSAGVNKISGSEFVDSAGGFDVESLPFTVPEGAVLESIEYEYDYSVEPGALSLDRGLGLWRGNFSQQLGSRNIVFLFAQNPSIEDSSPVSLFDAALPLGPGSYILANSHVGHEGGGWPGQRTWDYTVRFTVRSTRMSDTTAPTIIPTIISEGSPQNGWYRNDVELYWTVDDAQSAIAGLTGCGAIDFNSDTNATYTCSANSTGGAASQGVTIRRDSTRPVVNAMFGPLPNIHGWNNSNVTVSYEGSDPPPGSGISTCSPNFILSNEGNNLSAFGFCSDVAGNGGFASVTGIRIDKTAPTASLQAPANGASYPAGSIHDADFTCADARSGVLSCNAPAPSGTPFDTSTEGPKTFTVTATDLAGHVTSVSHNYTVTDPDLPLFVLSETALAFADQATSVSSPAQLVTVTNTGLVALLINSINRNGTNANQFTVAHDCGASLPAGASCTVSVVFRPTTAGAKIAQLNVNGGGGAGSKSVPLTGTGVVPTFELAPADLAYGIQARNIPSGALSVMLSNTGSVDLPITSVTRTGTNANQFSQTNNCGTQVVAGASCAINVVFLPTSTGDKVATLNVNTGGGAGTKAVNLTGTGVVPVYSLAPNPLAFGDQVVTLSSAARTVTLSNTGQIPLPLTNIALSGGAAAQFSQGHDCPASVDVGASCTISVVFTPTGIGARTTNLSVTAGGGAGNQSVSVTGIGAAPSWTLSPATLAFGDQARGVSSVAQPVTLLNTSPIPLTVASITRNGTNANQFSLSHDCGTSVAVGASCTINVGFLPTSAGDKVATLTASLAPGAGTKTVSLTGTGIVPLYSLAPGALDFGNQLRNTSSSPQSLTLTNTGEIALPITSIALNGGNAGQFSQTHNCGVSLAVGASCTIDVIFRPTTPGAKTSNVRVVFGGGAATPALIPVTGTGT